MLQRSWSKVSRSVLVAGAVASSLFGAGEALARPRHFGLVPPAGAPREAPSFKPFGGADTQTQCGVITYCGGPVISNVEIVPVYWTKNSTTVTKWAPGYFSEITNSAFMDMLSEYSTKGQPGEVCSEVVDGGVEYAGPINGGSTGQTITRGTVLPAVQITPTVTTGTTIQDENAAIGAEIAAQIKAKVLPAPTYDAQGYPNTIYFIFFPASYKIELGTDGSCSAFGGYHMSAPYDAADASCAGKYIPYAVIPDCPGSDTTADFSVVVSHELAEAVTDTDVGPTQPNLNNVDLAWYLGPSYPCGNNNCPSDCGEVGDVCQSAGQGTVTGTSPAITVQDIWSQKQSASCDLTNPSLSAQPAPSGAPRTTCSGIITTTDAGPQPGTDGGPTPPPSGDAGPSNPPDATVPPPVQTDDAGNPIVTPPDNGGDDGGGPAVTSGEDGGGNFATGGGPAASAGCACTTASVTSTGTSTGLGALGAMFAVALLAARRRSSRAGDVRE